MYIQGKFYVHRKIFSAMTENSEELQKAQRFAQWVDGAFATRSEAARQFGEDYRNFQKFFNGTRKISANIKMKAMEFGLNVDWLESGSGLITKDSTYKNTQPSGERFRLKSVHPRVFPIAPVENAVLIRMYLQRANAGIGVPLESTSSSFFRAVDASLVRDASKAFCMFTSGDSMLSAGIIDGSFLICEERSGDWQNLLGRIVIANVNGVTVVKRLMRERDRYILRSESPTKHPDIVLTESDVGIIQGVVLSAHNDIENYRVKQ